MQTLFQDLRYGARMLLRQPGFSLIAVVIVNETFAARHFSNEEILGKRLSLNGVCSNDLLMLPLFDFLECFRHFRSLTVFQFRVTL
jgi:hypothetical protein